VIGLGASETYGANRNGDLFPEFPYRPGQKHRCGHAACAPLDGAWISQAETLPNHYKSFEEHGRVFRHHRNTSADLAVGDILKAFWSPSMHRVELLLGIRNELAPDLAQRIADGDYLSTSMGCRIKYDVCSICANKAPTRKQYCDHLKYSMRQIDASGTQIGALNPSPKFFDCSVVIKPADVTAMMMRKVADEQIYEVKSSAELGEYLDNVEEKRAAIRKIADIDKIVKGLAVDHKTSPLSESEVHNVQQYRDMVLPAVQRMPELDDTTIKSLSRYPVAQVLSTLSAAGVILTTPEFVKMIVERLAPGTPISDSVLDGIVAMQGHIFDLFVEHPQLLEQLGGTGMFDRTKKNVNPEIGVIAEKYLEKRSTISNYLSRNLIPAALREEEPPWTDVLHVRDPATGESYATTRGAARMAHDEIAQKELMRLIGTGALLAGGARVASGVLPQNLRPLAWGGAALMGHKALRPNYGPQYLTDENIPISTLTELQKESNEALPLLGAAGIVTALSHDYDSRLRRGKHVHNPHASISRRLLDRVGEHASENPLLDTAGLLGLYGLTRKFADIADSVTLPEIDIDTVVEKIGSILLK